MNFLDLLFNSAWIFWFWPKYWNHSLVRALSFQKLHVYYMVSFELLFYLLLIFTIFLDARWLLSLANQIYYTFTTKFFWFPLFLLFFMILLNSCPHVSTCWLNVCLCALNNASITTTIHANATKFFTTKNMISWCWKDEVGVSKVSTHPGNQIGAFEAQVEARMIPVAIGILVVK